MKESLTVRESNIRLDKWLSSQFPYSRNFFHHIIQRGGVTKKSGNTIKVLKKSYKVKVGEVIYIDDLQRFLDGGILDETPQIDIDIVYETTDYLVINKPKGVLSHPNSIRDVAKPSVVGFLYHRYKNLPTIGNFVRAGLIHRLDKDTDGLMILAKSEKGMTHFKKLFQQKSESDTIDEKESIPLKKFYRTTCVLTTEGKHFLDRIEQLPHYIVQDVIPKVPHPIVKEGITKIMEYDIVGDQVRCALEILTGRTHQIRYHLSALGLPIVGDYLYNPEYVDSDILQLTSYRLEFEDMKGEMIILEI